MQRQVVALFAKKLSDALRVADAAALDVARAQLAGIGPGPSCPHVGDVMRNLQHALAKGHIARERVAKELAAETASSYEGLLSPSLVNELMGVVEKQFPTDHFVQAAQNTRGLYQRKSAPANKFNERAFELELSLIAVGASNNATTTVSRMRTLFDEALLRHSVSSSQVKPATQERIVSQINFNGPVSGQVTVAGESINSTVLNLSLGDIAARIEASTATPEEKEAATSKLKAFLSHPLVTAIAGGIVGGAGS